MISFMRRIKWVWVIFSAYIVSEFLSVPVCAQPATLTLNDIIRGCQATENQWKKLKNWMIHYRHIRDSKDPAPGTEAEFPPMEKVNARRGSWFYAYENQGFQRRLNPHSRPTDKIHYWILWKDGVSLERTDDDVSILPEPSTLAYQMFFFTGWLFLDMLSDMEVRSDYLRKIYKGNRPSDKDADIFLPRCLIEHRAEYRVRLNLEKVDGHLCHVVEWPNHDVIWIDPTIGFMARRRLLYNPAAHLAADVAHVGYEQKAPGIWIPRDSKSFAYNLPTAPEPYRTKVKDLARNILIEAKFNDVPDSFFTVPVPDGVRIHDFIRGQTYEKLKPTSDPIQEGLKKAIFDLSVTEMLPQRDWGMIGLIFGIGLQLTWTGYLIISRRKRA